MAKVLVATDGSNLARRAAESAKGLLAPDAEVTVLSVVQTVVLPAGDASGLAGLGATMTPVALDDATEGARASAADDVRDLMESLGLDGRCLVEEGEPGATICRVAAQGRFDVVVIGSHGHGAVRRALLGSVSHHVLHHAPCPVLVVREEAQH